MDSFVPPKYNILSYELDDFESYDSVVSYYMKLICKYTQYKKELYEWFVSYDDRKLQRIKLKIIIDDLYNNGIVYTRVCVRDDTHRTHGTLLVSRRTQPNVSTSYNINVR